MKYTDIIKRAFRIAWTHKSLWLLGFLASLGSGGSGGNFSTGGNAGGREGTTELPGWMDTSQISRWLAENSGAIMAAICVLLCVFFVLWLVMLVLGEIGQGGLIANVNEIERDGRPGFGDGWRAGVARVRTLVGMRLLLSIPGILLGLIFVSILVISVVGTAGSAVGGRNSDEMIAMLLSAGAIGFLCLVFPLLCVFVIYSIAVGILETFGRRAIMLENLGAVDGIKRGWELFRSRLGDSIVLAILMAIIRTVLAIFIVVLVAIIAPCIIFGDDGRRTTDGDGRDDRRPTTDDGERYSVVRRPSSVVF